MITESLFISAFAFLGKIKVISGRIIYDRSGDCAAFINRNTDSKMRNAVGIVA